MITRSIMIGLAAVTMVACGADVTTTNNEVTPLSVFIAADGSMTIDGEVVDAADVKRRAGQRIVHLQGSPDLQYSQFQKAMSDLQELNIPIAMLGEDAGPQ